MLRKLYHNNFGSGGSIWDQAQFFAPLKTTLVLSRGTGNPTFTRATTAYVKDFEDVWRQVPSGAARFEGARVVRNLWGLDTEDFTGWGLLNIGATSGITDPFGGTAASRMVPTAASGTHATNPSFTPSHSSQVLQQSIYAKAAGYNYLLIQINCGGVNAYQVFNLSTGAIGTTSSGGGTAAIEAAGNGYYRCSLLKQVSSVAAGPCRYWVQDTDSISAFSGDTTSGIDYYGPQLEDVTGASDQTASEYVSNGVLSAPYHGAGVDGIKYFATDKDGAAIPDATLKGYFAEAQRQNRCIYAQDFTNAAWVSGGGGIAVTPNTAVAPDGTTTADTLTASGANGTLIQDLGVVASAAKAGGMWLKRKTGTGNIDLTLDGGSTWTTVAVTSSWLLLEKTQTLANEDFGIRIVTSGDAVYAWTAQVETAAFISSPIPTTTAAVTRNGDVLTYSPTGNVGDSESTVYCETTIYAFNSAGLNQICILGNCMGIDRYNTTDIALRGMGINVDTLLNLADDTFGKCAFVAKEAASRAALNGSLYSNNTTTAYVAPTRIDIGVNNISNQVFGNVRNVKIWTKALTEAQLESITTP